MHNKQPTKTNGHVEKEKLTLNTEENVGGQTANKPPRRKKQSFFLRRRGGRGDRPHLGMI